MRVWLKLFLVIWLAVGCQRAAGGGSSEGSAATPAQAAGAAQPGACLGEGEGSSAMAERMASERGEQVPGCCPGLTKLEAYEPALQPGQCLPSKGGRFTCARCGDGQCLEGENHCNCPADCP